MNLDHSHEIMRLLYQLPWNCHTDQVISDFMVGNWIQQKWTCQFCRKDPMKSPHARHITPRVWLSTCRSHEAGIKCTQRIQSGRDCFRSPQSPGRNTSSIRTFLFLLISITRGFRYVPISKLAMRIASCTFHDGWPLASSATEKPLAADTKECTKT